MKKIAIICLTLVLSLALVGCNEKERTFEEDDIIYYQERDYSSIIGLTEEGKKKKHIILKDEVRNQEVRIGRRPIRFPVAPHLEGELESENVEKVYIMWTSNRNTNVLSLENLPKVKKFFYISIDAPGIIERKYFESIDMDGVYNANDGIFEPDYECRFYFANVSYRLNYEETLKKDFYFIDDYDDELIDFIPKNPIREGYEFKGWYKEKECLNLWDFKEDKVNKKKYDDNQKYVYEETILYAGWDKKN
ncbi:hypothetical protein BN85403500 [Alteracholeplasma palmae J233]|uniref:Uncharacterized protein n=1 Tax=Alteracholeplasma palmae (strain ATCC 49389 / J233) TaxID=1318466 RepID=U4KK71_ALTPJ|nr:InlB B-repeat-containing protein [Alteracholeplasma palmae]CCV63927.1 hypothetical protein BN85403500 [Alteracholeplasma palmae J233]